MTMLSAQEAQSLSAVAAVASAGSAIHFGQKGRQAQKRGLRLQEQAQRQAESRAAQQQRESASAIRRANQEKPDIAALLQQAYGFGSGIGSTFLSGLGGRKTPLGGGQ